MMEGMNQMGQEEYIWAMRTTIYRETSDSELWKERRLESEKKSKSLLDSTMNSQTKVMASMVPDEVIYNPNDYSHRIYHACFLFGDVSGFTELCEKYTNAGVSGPSRMTQVLNKYLGSMVQEILGHSGDVLKFSGDAFLAMYKTTESEMMRDAVQEALDTALVIQKNYGSYLTDVGVVIRVKLAISAGQVTFALIGDETTSHYVVVGKPIWDVKAAEHISSAGDIMVAPAAWHYVGANEYLFQEMPDNYHVKIIGAGPGWRGNQKSVRSQKQEEDDQHSIGSESMMSSILDVDVPEDKEQDEFLLRPAVQVAVRNKIKEYMRKFILTPVLKSISMNEPFEYLTEMRQAVVAVINVVSDILETKDTVILADRTYKTVCRIVENMKGCVNKVSLFDKDMMFVVIFGLRGLKHELECQVALRCARECHQSIGKLPGVQSTSIGVTTGKTYCGVFGHTLRREYTVISLIVNKAARLMVAYKGKVTCDRETFLHSKLEARHFILQEYKPLKGITNPGPVYEFSEMQIDHHRMFKTDIRPLLGRQEILTYYKKIIDKFDTLPQYQQYKMLLVKGDARQGKTRVLDELLYITPKTINVTKITLNLNDRKVPYQAIRQLLSIPLQLDMEASPKERESKLIDVLGKMPNPEYMCTLNNVFNVKFNTSPVYKSLNNDAKSMTLQKVIRFLSYNIFISSWVLAIDNCDCMDDESIDVFSTLYDIKTLFLVGTMGRDKLSYPKNAHALFNDSRVKIIGLGPIDKWYLGALACQILEVYAISPELENAIQTRSNGSPGWIESFLISLIQSQGIYVLKSNLRDINDLGLVTPPFYLMYRLNRSETLRWQQIMEEKTSLDKIKEKDYWDHYIDCCRDSYLNVTIREQMEFMHRGDKVPICVISPNFRLGEEEAEHTIDSMMLKTFDSLNFFEQLLVKCSAILGNQFLRDMLFYVMSASNDKRKVALAVKKLFEIKVLTCARGDFLDIGARFLKERTINPNEDTELLCRCKGIRLDDECLDLPNYASCGYMQFRSTLFREITYNLLTDNQKKDFHQRAIRYLERETKKCKACGNGYFDNILGGATDKEMIGTRDKYKDKNSLSISSSIDTDVQSQRSVNMGSGRRASVFSHGSGGSYRRAEDGKSVASFPGAHMTDRNDTKKTYSYFFGFTIISKLKDSYSLTRAFSSEDFTDCRCRLILSTTYAQLIEHCAGAGETHKEIEARMEYARISILLSNMPLAIKILEEALDIVRAKVNLGEDFEWKLSLIRGKIYTLIGYSSLELGNYSNAYENLKKSLQEYGAKFPKGAATRLFVCKHETKQLFGFYFLPRFLMKHMDHWETIYNNNLCECLSHLYTYHTSRNDWKNARLSACWCLTKALQSFSDFKILCTAFANMLHIVQHFGNKRMILGIEVHALRLCHLKKGTIDAEDMKCVATLYATIFYSRMLRSEVEKATHIGYIVLRMCFSIRALAIALPLLPLMVLGLLLSKRFANAHSLLNELEYYSNEDADSSGRIWYLALCVSIQLDTGYTVLSYQECERIYQMEGDRWVAIRDPDSRKRFFTVMWLWCIRQEKWEEAAIWCLKTSDFNIVTENDTMANIVTSLYLLEGMILFLVSKLDKRNIKGVIRAEQEIKCLIKSLERASKSNTFILPRLFHLKAYFKFVKNSDSKINDLMAKASTYAKKFGNELEVSWVEHSVKAWDRSLAPIYIEFWKEHTDEVDNLLKFEDIEIAAERLGHFTLPSPIYV